MEVDADAGVNTVRIRHLEFAQGRTLNQNAALQREFTATQDEFRGLRACQTTFERHMRDMECLLTESRTHPRHSHR